MLTSNLGQLKVLNRHFSVGGWICHLMFGVYLGRSGRCDATRVFDPFRWSLENTCHAYCVHREWQITSSQCPRIVVHRNQRAEFTFSRCVTLRVRSCLALDASVLSFCSRTSSTSVASTSASTTTLCGTCAPSPARSASDGSTASSCTRYRLVFPVELIESQCDERRMPEQSFEVSHS